MIETVFREFSLDEIIETLEPFLTEARMKRIEEVINQRFKSVHVAIESPADIHNAVAIVRTAEAFGVGHVHLIDANMKKRQGRSTARGTMHWTHLKKHTSFHDFLNQMRSDNFLLAGTCVKGGQPIESLPCDQPLCLLLGNERRGLSQEALEACDSLYTIPMYGMVESLNLSVSAAITLSKHLEKKREMCGQRGDLTVQEKLEEKAYFYVKSLGIQKSQAILKATQLRRSRS